MRKENIICLDIETTGLNPMKDEVLQVSAIDGFGNVLFDEYIRPTRHTEWPEAQAINHITPDMTANARTLSEVMPELQQLIDRADLIVGYNCDGFDLAFLEQGGLDVFTDTYDVMYEFMPIDGRTDEFGQYMRSTLQECARHYDPNVRYLWHDGLEDAKATLSCFYNVIQDRGWTVEPEEITEPSTVKAVLVEPGKPGRAVEIAPTLESLQQAVGGYIEEVHPFDESRLVLICNEEGKMMGLPQNRAFYDRNGELTDIICGSFLVAGIERENVASLTERQLAKMLDYFQSPEIYRDLPSPRDTFNYQLLDRLRNDCDYFLGEGNRDEKYLWAGNVKDQIAKMRELYSQLPEKPEWLTANKIDRYEELMAERPIGRIDFLSSDGTVRESVEYTSATQFKKDIREETYFGVPMGIVLYKDAERGIIPHDYIFNLDPPPKSYRIEPSPLTVNRQEIPTTGESISTPRGSFQVTSLTIDQMQELGYGYHHSSPGNIYHIMGNGTRAFAVKNDPSPEQKQTQSTPHSGRKI